MMASAFKPSVSIIIVNFNGGQTLLSECLASLIYSVQKSDVEIIVIDNDSQDKSFELAKNKFEDASKIRFLKNDRNVGFAAANNIAVKQAAGEYIIFLNNDTVVGDGWLENLLSPFSADEKIAVTQSKLLSYQEPQYIDSAGGYIDLLGNAMERGCFYSHYERDNGQYDRVQEIFSGCAAALAVKKVIFNEVGGFDDDFFILLEDVDLCWRIRLGGYKIVLAPHSVVFHHRGIARRSLSSKNQNVSSFHLYKNQVLMLLKNYGRIMLCIISPFVLMIYLLRLFRMRPAFEAMKWNVKSLHKTLQKRKQIQKNIRKVHDWKIIKHMDKMPLRIQYLLRRLGLIQT